MSLLVTVAPRSVYGRIIADPVDAPAKLFAQLVGQKTLLPEQLRIIKALGFDVVQVIKEGITL